MARTQVATKRKWYQTWQIYAILSVLAFGAAYLFASIAIDTGRILAYALTFYGLYRGVRDAVTAVKLSRAA